MILKPKVNQHDAVLSDLKTNFRRPVLNVYCLLSCYDILQELIISLLFSNYLLLKLLCFVLSFLTQMKNVSLCNDQC